jgi:hypothetical protein
LLIGSNAIPFDPHPKVILQMPCTKESHNKQGAVSIMSYLSKNKKWSELSTATKVRIVLLGVIQVSLMVAALMDIRKRPAEQIKGSKKMWTALAFVNWVGPIAYFVIGRKRGAAAEVTVSE